MRRKENHTSFIAVALGLTLAILVVFQIYIWREPARILADEEADRASAVAEGEILYAENCSACHGEVGDGGIGPALNSQELLQMASDASLFNLTQTGVPGTTMPAWGQPFGGPFTDEQVTQIIWFIRSWEPTAPLIEPETIEADPVRGANIYAQTCAICHGNDGQGTEIAPAINDKERLQKLEDGWYRSTIARGRPARGMPTWGTVLSPSQLNDLVALIASWRAGETVVANLPLATLVTNALFAIRDFDQPDAIFFLNASLAVTNASQHEEIRAIITLVEENRLFEADGRLTSLLPPEEMGRAIYSSNCAPCHGDEGRGGMGPDLHGNEYIQSQSDQTIIDMILVGRPGTPMDGFEGIIGPDELANVVTLLRSWQE